MKVLIDIDEARLPEIESSAKILGTEKDMTLDAVFTAEDVWNLIANPDSSKEPFDNEKLLNIESYGRKEFLETVVSRLNHHFDAGEGMNWDMVYNTVQDAYNDLALDKEQTAVVDHISVDGLRTALRRYEASGDLMSGRCGPWEIHTAYHDPWKIHTAYHVPWWEISHEGQVIVSCYASGEYGNGSYLGELGNLERERHLADKTFSNICKIVGEEFPECRMAPKEQQKIFGGKKTLGR